MPSARFEAAAAWCLELAEGPLSSERQQAFDAWLARQGASFITLMLAGKLRGCIGTLRPHRALGEDVKANAVGAAIAVGEVPR